MPNEFVARNGVIALNNSTVTGSLNVTAGITGSLLGTASFATTASFALNAGGAAAASNLIFSGSVTASVDVAGTTFRLISGSSTFLFVSSSGNVGIGNTSPSTRLHTAGSTQSTAAAGVARLGFADSSSVALFTNADPLYGTLFGTLSSGKGWIQQQRVDGTATAYDLALQPNGGNVGIGTSTATSTARLQVSGTVNVVNFRGSGSVATSSIFTVDGAAGRLFSVNDSLSGSLFSVNTIAGLPVVEAFSDNTVRIGQFGQRALFVSQSSVGIGIETTSAKLHVSSSTGGLLELDGTGSANVLYVSSSGRISVGRTDPGGRLDIAYAGNLNDPTILLGADDNANTVRTNNSSSLARIGLVHYNKTATASAILIAASTATANTLFIGGGSAYLNSATAIRFYTGATTASLTGTEIMRISGSSEIIISGSLNVSGSTTGIAEHMILAVSDETTALTTGSAKLTFRAPFAMTLTQIPRSSVSQSSSSGSVTVDINEAGTSILSTKLSIDATEKTSTTAATASVLSDQNIADDAEITLDIDAAGTGAKGLKVTLYYVKV